MAKIKLLRALWNGKADDEIDETKDRAEWAIRKGLAVKSDNPKKKTKIDPLAETKKDK